jgi:hypothetical protein
MARAAHVTLGLVAAAVLSGGLHGAESEETPRWEWVGVGRVVAIGDVHGEYEKLLTLLTGTGLIDDDLKWIGEADHLVQVGDMIDRGPDDRKILDLYRRIQTEAEASGGKVHILLGNHEVMNMTQDLRYVSDEGFAAFAEEEPAKARKIGWTDYKAEKFRLGTNIAELRRAFDEKHPPGYFARVAAFGPEGEYGSWLMAQPTIVKINRVVFVHGGLTPGVAALGLDRINRNVRTAIQLYGKHGKMLKGKIKGVPTYEAKIEAATTALEAAGESPEQEEIATLAKAMLALAGELPFSRQGPLWYRGTSLENERIERSRVRQVLELLDARAMVIGHTPTRSEEITSRFNGRVYRVDTGMAYGHQAQALLLREERARVFDPANLTLNPPMAEHPRGEGFSPVQEELTDRQIERLLAKGKVTKSEEIRALGRRVQIVVLESPGLKLRGVFQTVDEGPGQDGGSTSSSPRRYQHEVASYLLDRLLELDFVPVTITRTIDGKRGSLQIMLENAVDVPQIEMYHRWDLLEGLRPEINRARIYSALLGATDRADAGKMVLPHERRVMIADNTQAFSRSPEIVFLPVPDEAKPFVPDPCDPMGEAMEHALTTLDGETAGKLLGKLVTKQQIDALLQRRDRLLELCTDDQRPVR